MHILSMNPLGQTAFIDEANCIGCTKCIRACPADAIVGASRFMHTVVSQLCTACDHCIAVCPTNCIRLVSVSLTEPVAKWTSALNPQPLSPLPQSSKKVTDPIPTRLTVATDKDAGKAAVAAAIARVKARKAQPQKGDTTSQDKQH